MPPEPWVNQRIMFAQTDLWREPPRYRVALVPREYALEGATTWPNPIVFRGFSNPRVRLARANKRRWVKANWMRVMVKGYGNLLVGL